MFYTSYTEAGVHSELNISWGTAPGLSSLNIYTLNEYLYTIDGTGIPTDCPGAAPTVVIVIGISLSLKV